MLKLHNYFYKLKTITVSQQEKPYSTLLQASARVKKELLILKM
ncbi:hypothetical protein [Spiroplasma endosymbiont of Polydrusus formosus]